MRVKSLVAVVGLAVAAALVVPGVSSASRSVSPPETTEPVVEPTVEAPPAEPIVEETPVTSVDETTPAEPVVDETPTEPVAVTPKVKPASPVVAEPPTAPVVETPPVVEQPPAETVHVRPAPPAPEPTKTERGACHMDSYEPREVSGFEKDSGEAARAQKVDRNDNGTVCRKDIPGKGKGNTGEGSNIKDDQVR